MVQIKIDQAAHAAGVAGVAREDLATGSPVTLSSVGGPYFRYQWTLISKPFDVDTSTRSAAALATPTTATSLLTPVDQEGTYLVELVVDSGSGLGALETDVTRITFYAGPTLATAAGDLPIRQPAVAETTEHNVGGNLDGWGATWRRWFRAIKAMFAVRSWAQAVVTYDGISTVTIERGVGIASGSYDGAIFSLVFSSAFPNTGYGVLVTPEFNGGSAAIPHITNRTTAGFGVLFLDGSNVTSDVERFTVDVILRG